MRRCLVGCMMGMLALCFACPASAGPLIVAAAPAGSAALDDVLELSVRARGGGGVRVSFPDLQGGFAESACREPEGRWRAKRDSGAPAAAAARGGHLPRFARHRPSASSFAVPYRPGFVGSHLLEVAVTGGCGAGTSRASVPFEVGEQSSGGGRAMEAAACRGADRGPAPRDMRAMRRAVLCLVNDARRAAGVPALAPAEPLRRVASAQVHVLRRDAPFGHAAPGVGGLAERLGAGGVLSRFARHRASASPLFAAAENLAAATGAVSSPRSVVTAWLASDPLRDNLLDPAFTSVGIAVLGSVSNVMNHPGTTVSAVFATAG